MKPSGARILAGTFECPAPRRDDRADVGEYRRRPRRPRRARLPAPGNPLDLRRAGRAGRALRPRADRRGSAEGRPGRHLGAELRRVGARPVRHREDRRDPRQHQPGLPRARAGVRAAPVGLRDADPRARLQDRRLPGDGREARRGARPDARRWCSARAGRRCWRGRTRSRPRQLAEREAELDFDDPINIQYTLGHDRLPQGRDALAPQHPQQRLLRRRGAAATRERRPGLHPGAASTTASAW